MDAPWPAPGIDAEPECRAVEDRERRRVSSTDAVLGGFHLPRDTNSENSWLMMVVGHHADLRVFGSRSLAAQPLPFEPKMTNNGAPVSISARIRPLTGSPRLSLPAAPNWCRSTDEAVVAMLGTWTLWLRRSMAPITSAGCSCPSPASRTSCIIDDDRVWTCGKGVYAEPVAEMALALGAGRAAQCPAVRPAVGVEPPAGAQPARRPASPSSAVAASPSRCCGCCSPSTATSPSCATACSRWTGADDVLEADRYADALPGADLVVLALALTPETEGDHLGAGELALMERHAWIVNVARGRHIVTDDLVAALREGSIGGAGLDVTDPEPLPAGHPLWSLPNCIITPHVGNTPEMAVPLLAERITANVRRFAAARN